MIKQKAQLYRTLAGILCTICIAGMTFEIWTDRYFMAAITAALAAINMQICMINTKLANPPPNSWRWHYFCGTFFIGSALPALILKIVA